MSKQKEEGLTQTEMFVIGLGFSTLVMSLISIMSIKSTIGFLNLFHENLFLAHGASLLLLSFTIYIDKKFNNLLKAK